MAKVKKRKLQQKIGLFNNIPMPEHRAEFSKWANKLEYKDFKIVTEFVQEEVNREVERIGKKEFDRLVTIVDRNITAALILETDFTLDKINEILSVSCELMPEDVDKMNKLEKKGDGDWMKVVEKKASVVTDRAIELVKEGYNQKKASEVLASEFPMFSKAMVINCYKKCKEEMKRQQEESKKAIIETESEVSAEEVKEAYEHIFEEEAPEEENNIDYIAKDEELVSDPKETGLVILNKKVVMDLAGEFGTYHVEDNVVTNEDIVFKSVEDVNKWSKDKMEQIIRQQEEALKIYKIIGV